MISHEFENKQHIIERTEKIEEIVGGRQGLMRKQVLIFIEELRYCIMFYAYVPHVAWWLYH